MEIPQQDCDSTGTLQETHHLHMLPKLPAAFNTKRVPVIIKINNLPLTHAENKLNGEESQT
jgi:hypothetical protein